MPDLFLVFINSYFLHLTFRTAVIFGLFKYAKIIIITTAATMMIIILTKFSAI